MKSIDVTNSVFLACVALGPDAWAEAQDTLVKVKLPDKISELLGHLSLNGVEGATQADAESALINDLVLEGLGALSAKFMKDPMKVKRIFKVAMEALEGGKKDVD